MEKIPKIKNIFSFNIGTTSYVYPDDILPNIRLIKDRIDEVELILFEGKEYSNLPDKSTISELVKISEESGIKYNVHFPIDIKLLTKNTEEYKNSVKVLKKVFEITKPLNPISATLHIEPFNKEIFNLKKHEILSDLLKIFDFSYPVCIENTHKEFEIILDFFNENGFNICFDIGHIFKDFPKKVRLDKIKYFFNRYKDNIKIIHLHGIINKKDHKTLKNIPKEILNYIIKKAESLNASLMLEIFSFDEIKESLEIIRSLK